VVYLHVGQGLSASRNVILLLKSKSRDLNPFQYHNCRRRNRRRFYLARQLLQVSEGNALTSRLGTDRLYNMVNALMADDLCSVTVPVHFEKHGSDRVTEFCDWRLRSQRRYFDVKDFEKAPLSQNL
jgi:hypothetical protein